MTVAVTPDRSRPLPLLGGGGVPGGEQAPLPQQPALDRGEGGWERLQETCAVRPAACRLQAGLQGLARAGRTSAQEKYYTGLHKPDNCMLHSLLILVDMSGLPEVFSKVSLQRKYCEARLRDWVEANCRQQQTDQ